MLMLVSTSSSLAVVEKYVVIRDDGAMSKAVLMFGDSKRSQINASDRKRLCAVQGLQPAAKAVLLR